MTDLAFQRLVAQVYRLGPRVMFELLAELGRERLIRQPVEEKLQRYAKLDPAALRATGGDKIPATPIHLVHRGDKS